MVPFRDRLYGLSSACSLAGLLPVSGLRGDDGVDDGPGPASMRWMRSPNIADCGDDFRGDAEAVAALVPGDVVRDESEAWGQCPGDAEDTWPWQLPDGLDVAS